MTTVHSPTAGRRRLRNALRQARDAAGFTQEHVAEQMDWSLSKLIRIETGTVSISTNDLRQLLQLYRIDDPARVAELVDLARIGRQRPWWTRYKDIVPATYLSYVGLEDECTAMRGFQPVGMHGLLQTEEFANALLNASWTPRPSPRSSVWPLPAAPPVAADRVDLRMIRQREVLRREPPPEITVVLDEAVLWRQIGGADVLRQQLFHLVALGSQPHIIIQVLPFTAHRLNILSPFVILEFPDPNDTDVVYAESAFEQVIVDKPADVETYRQVFEWLRDAALSEEESLALIAQVAGKIA